MKYNNKYVKGRAMAKLKSICKLFLCMCLVGIVQTNAQSNPIPQMIPYSQDFSKLNHNSEVYPEGWQGWILGKASNMFNTSSPLSDRVLSKNGDASKGSGAVYNYGGKIGFQNTSQPEGDFALVLAINTTGKKHIQVEYDVMTIRNPFDGDKNTRVNELTLQYRVGNVEDFTTFDEIIYENNSTGQISGTSPQNIQNRKIVLPIRCDNQKEIQLRWLSRQVIGSGTRPGFAVDNVKITGEDL